MPHHQDAAAIAAAIKNMDDAVNLARTWLEAHAADVDKPWVYDVGGGGEVLVVWPGWTPIDPPLDYIKIGGPGE